MNGTFVCAFAFPDFTVFDGDDFLLSVPLHYLHNKGSDYLHSKLRDMLNSHFVLAASSGPFCFPCH